MSNMHENFVPITPYNGPERGIPTIPGAVLNHYPQNLLNLVHQCLDPIPARRITAEDLLNEITRVVQDPLEDFDGVPMKSAGMSEQDILRPKKDGYALKMAS